MLRASRHREVASKPNEITAVPELRDTLHRDVMGCQKDDTLPESCNTNLGFCYICFWYVLYGGLQRPSSACAEGQAPDLVVAERLTARSALAKDKPAGRASPHDITKARLIADRAKEVSQPNAGLILEIKWKTAAAFCLTGFRRVPHRQWDRYGRQHRKPRVRDRQQSR